MRRIITCSHTSKHYHYRCQSSTYFPFFIYVSNILLNYTYCSCQIEMKWFILLVYAGDSSKNLHPFIFRAFGGSRIFNAPVIGIIFPVHTNNTFGLLCTVCIKLSLSSCLFHPRLDHFCFLSGNREVV